MKHLKMVAVAAVAVGALMAMVGASSAMAANSTILCKGTGTCSAVTSSEPITGSSTNAELTSNIVNVICHTSSTEFHVSGATGAPETGTANALSFGSCETSSGTACTVTTQGFPASATLEHIIPGVDGKLTVTGSPGAKVVCGVLINCTFTTSKAELAFHGSVGTTKATAVASAIPLSSTGGLCPKTANWDATYTVSAPNSGILTVQE
jgi:hypothetical protein